MTFMSCGSNLFGMTLLVSDIVPVSADCRRVVTCLSAAN